MSPSNTGDDNVKTAHANKWVRKLHPIISGNQSLHCWLAAFPPTSSPDSIHFAFLSHFQFIFRSTPHPVEKEKFRNTPLASFDCESPSHPKAKGESARFPNRIVISNKLNRLIQSGKWDRSRFPEDLLERIFFDGSLRRCQQCADEEADFGNVWWKIEIYIWLFLIAVKEKG